MKSHLSACLLLGCLSLQAQQQDIPVEEAPALPAVESTAKPAPAPVPTPARIVGSIPDGTPPPPAPPKPPFIVAPQDILSTTTHQQGGRTITVREIQPIALPQPPEPPAPRPAVMDPALRERLRAYQATHPRTEWICLGATVYRSKNSPPRTLVRYWANGNGESVTFWSSADFSLLSGIHTFVDTRGTSHHILMAWGNVDIDKEAQRTTTRRRLYQVPEIPALPSGDAGYVIVGKSPDDAYTLVPIQSLHDLYNREHDLLLTAYQGRERARIQHEADLKANPPQPKNITLNYWRTETPAADIAKGGSK